MSAAPAVVHAKRFIPWWAKKARAQPRPDVYVLQPSDETDILLARLPSVRQAGPAPYARPMHLSRRGLLSYLVQAIIRAERDGGRYRMSNDGVANGYGCDRRTIIRAKAEFRARRLIVAYTPQDRLGRDLPTVWRLHPSLRGALQPHTQVSPLYPEDTDAGNPVVPDGAPRKTRRPAADLIFDGLNPNDVEQMAPVDRRILILLDSTLQGELAPWRALARDLVIEARRRPSIRHPVAWARQQLVHAMQLRDVPIPSSWLERVNLLGPDGLARLRAAAAVREGEAARAAAAARRPSPRASPPEPVGAVVEHAAARLGVVPAAAEPDPPPAAPPPPSGARAAFLAQLRQEHDELQARRSAARLRSVRGPP